MFRSMDDLVNLVVLNLNHRKCDEDIWNDAIGRTTWMENNGVKLVGELLRLGDLHTMYYAFQNHYGTGALNALAAMKQGSSVQAHRRIFAEYLNGLPGNVDPETGDTDDTMMALAFDIIKYECVRRGHKVTDYVPWNGKEIPATVCRNSQPH